MSQTGVTKYPKLSLKGILSRFTIKSLRSLTHVHAHDLLKVEYPLRPFELKLLTLTLSLSLCVCAKRRRTGAMAVSCPEASNLAIWPYSTRHILSNVDANNTNTTLWQLQGLLVLKVSKATYTEYNHLLMHLPLGFTDFGLAPSVTRF
jgi:hypothetical protein